MKKYMAILPWISSAVNIECVKGKPCNDLHVSEWDFWAIWQRKDSCRFQPRDSKSHSDAFHIWVRRSQAWVSTRQWAPKWCAIERLESLKHPDIHENWKAGQTERMNVKGDGERVSLTFVWQMIAISAAWRSRVKVAYIWEKPHTRNNASTQERRDRRALNPKYGADKGWRAIATVQRFLFGSALLERNSEGPPLPPTMHIGGPLHPPCLRHQLSSCFRRKEQVAI